MDWVLMDSHPPMLKEIFHKMGFAVWEELGSRHGISPVKDRETILSFIFNPNTGNIFIFDIRSTCVSCL